MEDGEVIAEVDAVMRNALILTQWSNQSFSRLDLFKVGSWLIDSMGSNGILRCTENHGNFQILKKCCKGGFYGFNPKAIS